MSDRMLEYNKMIAHKMMENDEHFVKTFPQPLMFGGRRLREYILSGSNDMDHEPSTLFVRGAHMPAESVVSGAGRRTKKGGNFLNDFGHGFVNGFTGAADVATGAISLDPQKMKEGMNTIAGKGRKPRKVGGVNHLKKFDKWYKSIAEKIKPVVKPIAEAATKKAVEKIEGAGRKKLVKGSPEAKAWGKKMRLAKLTKKK
jgi:hypothetical protein